MDAVVEAKRRGYPVKLGLEVDYQPDRAEELDEMLAPYPWDYLIGSIHFIDGLAIDQEPSLVGAVGVERGVGSLLRIARRRRPLGDVLGHPDLIKFFGPEIEWDWVELAMYRSKTSASRSRAPACTSRTESSTRTLACSVAGRERGLTITLASDAHVPQNVGRDLDRAIEHARAAGYETVTVFDQREGRQEPLG